MRKGSRAATLGLGPVLGGWGLGTVDRHGVRGAVFRCHARSAARSHRVDDPVEEAVPAARGRRVEAVGVPEDRERRAVLGRLMEQPFELAPCRTRRQSEIAPFGQGYVHHRQRYLDEIERSLLFEIPWP